MYHHRSRRTSGRILQGLAAFSVLLLFLLGGFVLCRSSWGAEPPPPSPVQTLTPTPHPTAAPTPVPTAPPTETPVPSPVATPGTAQTLPGVYSYALPAGEAADISYFADAAFMGDSLTDGLWLYTPLNASGAANLSYKGLNVKTAGTDAVITQNGKKVTPVAALGSKTYGKIYLLLGVNELGWYNDLRFYKTYGDLIDMVRDKQPDATIYLQTLLPVTAEKSATHAYINNPKILVYNDLIAKLAEEKGVCLLDTHTAFVDGDGALPADESSDGVHLKKNGYAVWLEYLKTHTAP